MALFKHGMSSSLTLTALTLPRAAVRPVEQRIRTVGDCREKNIDLGCREAQEPLRKGALSFESQMALGQTLLAAAATAARNRINPRLVTLCLGP